MKIHLNLAHTPKPRDRYALTWSIPIIIIALVALAWLGDTGIREFQKSRSLKASLESAQANDAQLQAQEVRLRLNVQRPELQSMVHETKFVNRLIDEKQFSMADLTVKVGTLLPPNVRLDSLGLSVEGSTPVVRLEVMGKNDDAVESFLEKLEDSNDFTNIIVKSQGVRSASNGAQQVALICTAQYLTGFGSAGK